jgi:hypothetical protein
LVFLGRTKIDLKFGPRLFRWARMALLLLLRFKFVLLEVASLALVSVACFWKLLNGLVPLLFGNVVVLDCGGSMLEKFVACVVLLPLLLVVLLFIIVGLRELLYGWVRRALTTTRLFFDLTREKQIFF